MARSRSIPNVAPGLGAAWRFVRLTCTVLCCGVVSPKEFRAGDGVWFPPGEKHWHGASPTTALMHIAIQEQLEGKAVDWLEKVSDEQYQAG